MQDAAPPGAGAGWSDPLRSVAGGVAAPLAPYRALLQQHGLAVTVAEDEQGLVHLPAVEREAVGDPVEPGGLAEAVGERALAPVALGEDEPREVVADQREPVGGDPRERLVARREGVDGAGGDGRSLG